MTMSRTLYHFVHSPFSRRTRLAIAHKGVDVALVEGRAEPAKYDEVRSRSPIKTAPIFVDGDRVLGDSTAICRYLDVAYPGPAIFPTEIEAATVTAESAELVDVTLQTVIDVGTRYWALRDSSQWDAVRDEMLGRAYAALDRLGKHAASRMGKTWTDAGWSAADMWVATMTIWFEGMPGRVNGNPKAQQIVSLGVKLPDTLHRWVDGHRSGKELAALG